MKSKTKGKAKVGSFDDAATFGEIVVVATEGTAAEVALRAAGIACLKGKTVIPGFLTNSWTHAFKLLRR